MRADLGLTGDDDSVDEPPEAATYYPAIYALRTWRQNAKHGTFPDGGAYNDLDPQLRVDWDMLTARYNWHFDELRPRDDGNGNRSSKRGRDALDELAYEIGDAPDIDQFFRE